MSWKESTKIACGHIYTQSKIGLAKLAYIATAMFIVDLVILSLYPSIFTFNDMLPIIFMGIICIISLRLRLRKKV
jgi:hypothetical protein